MEIGLRKSWSACIREEPGPYGEEEPTFAHESLQVYQRGLDLLRVLVEDVLVTENLKNRHVRRIDELVTSLLLNIAEGNGRFSQLDHRQFIRTAEESGVRLAAYLDLVSPNHPRTSATAKSFLRDVMAMVAGLKGYLDTGSE